MDSGDGAFLLFQRVMRSCAQVVLFTEFAQREAQFHSKLDSMGVVKGRITD